MTELVCKSQADDHSRRTAATTSEMDLTDARMRVVAFLATDCRRNAITENKLGDVDEKEVQRESGCSPPAD